MTLSPGVRIAGAAGEAAQWPLVHPWRNQRSPEIASPPPSPPPSPLTSGPALAGSGSLQALPSAAADPLQPLLRPQSRHVDVANVTAGSDPPTSQPSTPPRPPSQALGTPVSGLTDRSGSSSSGVFSSGSSSNTSTGRGGREPRQRQLQRQPSVSFRPPPLDPPRPSALSAASSDAGASGASAHLPRADAGRAAAGQTWTRMQTQSPGCGLLQPPPLPGARPSRTALARGSAKESEVSLPGDELLLGGGAAAAAGDPWRGRGAAARLHGGRAVSRQPPCERRGEGRGRGGTAGRVPAAAGGLWRP